MNIAVLLAGLACTLIGIIALSEYARRIGFFLLGTGILLLIWMGVSWNYAVPHTVTTAPVTVIVDNQGHDKQVFCFDGVIYNANYRLGCVIPPGHRIEVQEYRWSWGIYWGVTDYRFHIAPPDTTPEAGPEKGTP